MVARLLLAPRPFVDVRGLQAVGGLGRAKQMVDAEAGVALPAPGGIVPEGVEPVVVRMKRAKRVGPALVEDSRQCARVSGCISASLAIARTEKTSRSSGMTLKSPARITGRSSGEQFARALRAAAPSSEACSRTSRCRSDCRWGGRGGDDQPSAPSPRPRYSGCACRPDRRAGRRGGAPECRPSPGWRRR